MKLLVKAVFIVCFAIMGAVGLIWAFQTMFYSMAM